MTAAFAGGPASPLAGASRMPRLVARRLRPLRTLNDSFDQGSVAKRCLKQVLTQPSTRARTISLIAYQK